MLQLLCAILRDEAPPWPYGDCPEAAAGFVDEAVRHAVHALVCRRLEGSGAAGWPASVLAALASRSTAEAALDLLREIELRKVLVELASSGVCFVLVKGAAVGCTHYEKSYLRPRFDTDIVLARENLSAASRVLERLGYTRPLQSTGRLLMHQFDYVRVDERGVRHVFDLHWKLVNPHVLADTLPFEDLAADSISIERRGLPARVPSAVHSLLAACIHRVAHHSDDERLIWLYDIHLLASSLTEGERERFTSEARKRRVSAVCASGLKRAQLLLGTKLPAGFVESLGAGFAPGVVPGAAAGESVPAVVAGMIEEPSAEFARGRLTKLDVLVSDLRALASWRDRFTLLREHALPAPSYMLRSYGVSNRAALPALYAHRLFRGAWRWLRRKD